MRGQGHGGEPDTPGRKPIDRRRMEILQFKRPEPLPNVDSDLLAFDLEMANSFRSELPVICMIGTESYDPRQQCALVTLATITKRHQEFELIGWFLDHLSTFHQRHPNPKLVTFSGSDNDIPWINERIERFGFEPERVSSFRRFEHLDLRVKFHQRTQNNQISLKKMEELFGIVRDSTLSSRKVSYILTGVVGGNSRGDGIPEKIYDYLQEDVHHLLVILDRWDAQSVETHHFTELEYLERCLSLLRQCRRPGERIPPRVSPAQLEAIERFADALETNIDRAIVAGGFQDFQLQPLPELNLRFSEVERIAKKFHQLSGIELWEPETRTFRLKPLLNRPKGALAVVRRSGKVLMIRRAEHLERAPGYWGLPGGVLEKGENPRAGAVRELKEELNLDGRAVRLMGTSPSMTKEFELFWVEVEVEDTTPLQPQAEEVAEARWVTPESFHQLSPLIPGAEDGFRRFLGSAWGPRGNR